MPLVSSDLKVHRSAVNNDTGTNGGGMSSVLSVSGVSGNLFPRVTIQERTDGITRYRKAFHRVSSSLNKTLFDAFLMMFRQTPAVDSVTFFLSDFSETQSAIIPASKTHYGAGSLVNSVTGGAMVIRVIPEQSNYAVFRVGDRIYISDKAAYTSGTGSEEYATIDAMVDAGGGAWDITLTSALLNGYTSPGTYVASLLELGDVETAKAVESTTIAGTGTFDIAAITVDQRGALNHEITLTFTSATAFTASSNVVGSLGSGSRSSTFQPVNPQVSAPYVTIPATAWGGTFEAADEIVFSTVPASKGVFYMQAVPAGAAEFSGNSFVMVMGGETE